MFAYWGQNQCIIIGSPDAGYKVKTIYCILFIIIKTVLGPINNLVHGSIVEQLLTIWYVILIIC